MRVLDAGRVLLETGFGSRVDIPRSNEKRQKKNKKKTKKTKNKNETRTKAEKKDPLAQPDGRRKNSVKLGKTPLLFSRPSTANGSDGETGPNRVKWDTH